MINYNFINNFYNLATIVYNGVTKGYFITPMSISSYCDTTFVNLVDYIDISQIFQSVAINLNMIASPNLDVTIVVAKNKGT
jgi:hypothetical protein